MHGKSCYHEREDTILFFFRFEPDLTSLNRFKRHVWQKEVFAGRNPTLMFRQTPPGVVIVSYNDRRAINVGPLRPLNRTA